MSQNDSEKTVALLEEIHQLMQLKGENPFKVRAFEKAVGAIAGVDDLTARARAGTLTEIAGIGKGISEVLTEFLLQGTSKARDELRASLPAGLMELTQIPGLGPKKALKLIEDLGISSVAELEYACKENRLLKIAGFGEKLQHKILEGISFLKESSGQQRLSDVFPAAEKIMELIRAVAPSVRASEAGALRRRLEILAGLEFVIESSSHDGAIKRKVADHGFKSLPVQLHFVDARFYGYELARLTATDAHWRAIGTPEKFEASSEEDFYARLDLPWIAPEMRETGEEVALARKGALADILPWTGIKGVFHNHTTRSDGVATLEEMVLGAKNLGFQYIGISDHSQSAVYAQGLKNDVLLEQEREIRSVQEKYPDVRIFWGIESDILADGSLDYDKKVLDRFDFVVASVHSRFGMDRETMTLRILEAVRNPATRFLGHLTGRLLLGRKGYELDVEKVIREAAAHDVAIELNSNPARLDIDWRWGKELRREKTLISVNPDAHEVEGLEDTKYGIAMSRKALMPTSLVVNSRSTADVANWLARA